MAPRKEHNWGAQIDPRMVEDMLAEGYTSSEIAFYFNVDRTTILKRCKVDDELKEAFRVGRERRRERLHRKLSNEENNELDRLLAELLNDIRSLKQLAA